MDKSNMIDFDQGHCTACGCYWQVSDDVSKTVGCKCECHD